LEAVTGVGHADDGYGRNARKESVGSGGQQRYAMYGKVMLNVQMRSMASLNEIYRRRTKVRSEWRLRSELAAGRSVRRKVSESKGK
jgi:hypothetical protein